MGNNSKRKFNSCLGCGSEKALKLIAGGLNKCNDCGKTFKIENGNWEEITK